MTDPKSAALQKIHDEHRSISAVLSGLIELAREASDASVRPDFRVFHAMFHYIEAFPERLHHPKEEQFLFAPLLRRAPESARLIAILRAQHEEGGELLRRLQRALLAFEIVCPNDAGRFGEAIKAYADFHWDHMRREETELLPLAERHFIAEDWQRMAAAFAGNEDPLGAGESEGDFRRLFARIANIAPAPVGLGDPWKRTTA